MERLTFESGLLPSIGGTVFELRVKLQKYDYSLTGTTRNGLRYHLSENLKHVYIREKACTKSDIAWIGRTVFLTREEAENFLRRAHDGKH